MYNEPLNSVVPITATAASGFTFTGWSSNVANPSAASTMVVITGAEVVTADFTGCQCPKNVTSLVTVTPGGFTYNMMTGLYSQTVTITNNTTSAFSGPISLVLDSLSTNATLSNATGTTDSLEPPAGSPYINFAGNLGSGMITLTLQFSDPTHALPITYTSRVLAGTGSR
jgi:hypothetical protein